MNHRQHVDCLLNGMQASRVAGSAYDTAWVARLDDVDAPLAEQALEWLRANQQADGSWGAGELLYYHDRAICTLSAVVALARLGHAQDRRRLRRALPALKTALDRLQCDRAASNVWAFDVNGTRRWFMAEHLDSGARQASAYLDATVPRYSQIIRMLFEHGPHTLLLPSVSRDVLGRGRQYMQLAIQGWAQLLTQPEFMTFCQEYGVRVRFYGDYQMFFDAPLRSQLIDLFEQVTAQTQAHTQRRLLFGLFAHDPMETFVNLAIQLYQAHGHAPTTAQLVQAYYGEDIAHLNLFVGFHDTFSTLDLPILANGQHDRYFTLAPSLYFNQQQLRTILYDHLYARRQQPDYAMFSEGDWMMLRDFYRTHLEQTYGVGTTVRGIWHPLPQVTS